MSRCQVARSGTWEEAPTPDGVGMFTAGLRTWASSIDSATVKNGNVTIYGAKATGVGRSASHFIGFVGGIFATSSGNLEEVVRLAFEEAARQGLDQA
jgi:hypothetical protein